MKRTCFVPGLPIAQGSKRHVGNGVMIESAKGLKPWRAAVVSIVRASLWHTDPILAGPVQLALVFVFPRPQYHYGTGKNAGQLKDRAPHWHDKKPDASKIQRAVEDALVDAGVLRDDCQIAVWSGAKEYGTAPGVRISLEPIVTNPERGSL